MRALIWGIGVTLTSVVLGWFPDVARADDHGTGVLGTRTDSGSRLGVLSKEQTVAAVRSSVDPAPDAPWYELGVTSVCGLSPDRDGFDNSCGRALGMCRSGDPADGLGPPIGLWLRKVDADGSPIPGETWVKQGDTCFPEVVPGARALTMAMVQRAFHDTDFAVPMVNIQPEGDVTLVNLPTYFEVRFPSRGFGPDEIDRPDPGRLLGYTVEVRPRLKEVTYYLGERTVGPTTDRGGPYPIGTVVQTYAGPGVHQIRVDIVYTGQFRVGGSGWIDIPGEVTVRGTPTTLSVHEARSYLYTD